MKDARSWSADRACRTSRRRWKRFSSASSCATSSGVLRIRRAALPQATQATSTSATSSGSDAWTSALTRGGLASFVSGSLTLRGREVERGSGRASAVPHSSASPPARRSRVEGRAASCPVNAISTNRSASSYVSAHTAQAVVEERDRLEAGGVLARGEARGSKSRASAERIRARTLSACFVEPGPPKKHTSHACRRRAPPRGGAFAPDLRASESPIAIACFRLRTFLPEPPERSVPCFLSCIAFSTLADAASPYRLFAVALRREVFRRELVERLWAAKFHSFGSHRPIDPATGAARGMPYALLMEPATLLAQGGGGLQRAHLSNEDALEA